MERERQERLRQAREAAKAREENTRTSQTDAGNGFPGTGDFYQFLKDPDVLQAFQVSKRRSYPVELEASLDSPMRTSPLKSISITVPHRVWDEKRNVKYFDRTN